MCEGCPFTKEREFKPYKTEYRCSKSGNKTSEIRYHQGRQESELYFECPLSEEEKLIYGIYVDSAIFPP